MFDSYRAKELSEVETLGNHARLKVMGDNGSETKWLTISITELEKIIAVLEPEDYKKDVPTAIRVTLPDLSE